MAGKRKSAGVLLHRFRAGHLEVLLAHPGGPFWKNKDEGAWSIPKGEIDEGEDPQTAAIREFAEETGHTLETLPVPLATIEQKGGKTVVAFAAEGDLDAETLASNTFEMEWPPRSGRRQAFPEIDRAAWLTLDAARVKILASQRPLIDALEEAFGR
ncbi:NUDIX domain-containing protein [Pararhizobium mangrovi]|uniref:NUDIX domain-containing protein n=1 Tax=Pararhizobium mangrovi TaxID=2590452 RepID=A0A506UEN6_9HYPH|nr:NUDIX domain-containing protein [Pararhizobium mangrovi]TPW31936.1 NUDIX domain-containing protein [Pararhizobium mangrovi]